MHTNKHYQAIAEFYGSQRAERSQVQLINHIDEGLKLLDIIGASITAKEAYCLHPLVQGDNELERAIQPGSILQRWQPDIVPVMLAMEYRKVANAYLSHHFKGDDDSIRLSPLKEVNDMLIADKVQNRKDFEIHHLATHKNAETLSRYFRNWLNKLSISEDRYRELALSLPRHEAAT